MDQVVIGFSRPKKCNPVSFLIRWSEHAPYSHVYVKMRSESLDRVLVYQAAHLMIHFVGWDMFCEHNEIIKEYAFEITPEQKVKMLQWCVDNAAKPYGIKQLIGMAWSRILIGLGRDPYNPFKDGAKTYVCSELGGNILKVLGYNLDADKLEVLGPAWLDSELAKLTSPQ